MTLLERLLEKGKSLDNKSREGETSNKRKWYAGIILFFLGTALLIAFSIKKRSLNKKRAKLVEKKNAIIKELKSENRKLQEEKFKDNLDKVVKKIESKKEQVVKIKEELRKLDDFERKEQEALRTISDWTTASKYFK